jgi:hypothetical protein
MFHDWLLVENNGFSNPTGMESCINRANISESTLSLICVIEYSTYEYRVKKRAKMLWWKRFGVKWK